MAASKISGNGMHFRRRSITHQFRDTKISRGLLGRGAGAHRGTRLLRRICASTTTLEKIVGPRNIHCFHLYVEKALGCGSFVLLLCVPRLRFTDRFFSRPRAASARLRSTPDRLSPRAPPHAPYAWTLLPCSRRPARVVSCHCKFLVQHRAPHVAAPVGNCNDTGFEVGHPLEAMYATYVLGHISQKNSSVVRARRHIVRGGERNIFSQRCAVRLDASLRVRRACCRRNFAAFTLWFPRRRVGY